MSKSTIANYERGDRTPDATMLERYRDVWSVDLNWLVTGDGAMFLTPDYAFPPAVQDFLDSRRKNPSPREAKPQPSAPAPQNDTFAFLPYYEDVEAAAGHGATVIADATHSVIGFARDLLREAGASPHHCTVIRARGDSMSPTLPEGALLVVDRSQQEIVANGSIMVVGVENDLLVKRIRRRLDGLIELISDNPAYPPETLGRDALQQLRVVGRVVYFCRVP